MTVSGLSTFLKQTKCITCLETTDHSELVDLVQGKVVAVDAMNMKRYGMLPVFVFDGQSPPEKSNPWKGYGTQAYRDLFRGLGFPVVQAPGEAEATCAALLKRGLVDCVASPDGDTMLFGAEIVFTKLRLLSEISVFRMERFRELIGLNTGGEHALEVIALLSGGDYCPGVEGVGPSKAVKVIRELLKYGAEEHLVETLFDLIQGPALRGLSREGNAVEKVLAKCRATPFESAARRASAAYRAQAAGALAGQGLQACTKFEWNHRPDIAAVAAVLRAAGVPWVDRTVEAKLSPLLMEWDVVHGVKGAIFPVRIVEEKDWQYLLEWDSADPALREWLAKATPSARSLPKAVLARYAPDLVVAWVAKRTAAKTPKRKPASSPAITTPTNAPAKRRRTVTPVGMTSGPDTTVIDLTLGDGLQLATARFAAIDPADADLEIEIIGAGFAASDQITLYDSEIKIIEVV